jgi:hypothetical protein
MWRRRENKEESLGPGFGSHSVALAVRERNEKGNCGPDCVTPRQNGKRPKKMINIKRQRWQRISNMIILSSFFTVFFFFFFCSNPGKGEKILYGTVFLHSYFPRVPLTTVGKAPLIISCL